VTGDHDHHVQTAQSPQRLGPHDVGRNSPDAGGEPSRRDPECRFLIFRGAGETFCACDDIKDFLTLRPKDDPYWQARSTKRQRR